MPSIDLSIEEIQSILDLIERVENDITNYDQGVEANLKVFEHQFNSIREKLKKELRWVRTRWYKGW